LSEKIEERLAEKLPEQAVADNPEKIAVDNNQPTKRGRGRPRKDGVTKKKINVKFTPDTGDNNPPPLTDLQAVNIPQIDYPAVATGLVTTIDMMLHLVSVMSKGKLEYQQLSEHEKKICAGALEGEKPVLDFMAKSQGMNHIVVLATFAGVFGTKIKIKKTEKTDKKESKKIIDLQEKTAEEKEIEFNKKNPLNIENKKEGEINFENL